jgi:hypothetical protein
MDAFLRRVVEQRDREQDAAFQAIPLERFKRVRCRFCSAPIRGLNHSAPEEQRVCKGCAVPSKKRKKKR